MPKLPNTLIVLPYDPNWATEFERIRDYLMEQIGDLVIEIKHTGSTSVPGLAAKPIIDIIAVMESYAIFPTIVSRLKKVGFQHEGDGGIKEREVFKRLIPDDFMDYHLYVCPKDSEENRRQTIFKNALLKNKEIADAYGKLKMQLIDEVNGDRVLYTILKTDFILGVIKKTIQESEIKLREFHSNDCKQAWDLFYSTIHSINRADYTDEQLDAWAPQDMDLNLWGQKLLRNSYSIVAEQNSIIIGIGAADDNGYFDLLYVHKDYQRIGVATIIANDIENYFCRKDVHTITTNASITAKPFFMKRGYYVLKKQIVELRGQYLTNYRMEKILVEGVAE